MTRKEFVASILTGATAVKAVAQTEGGKAPAERRLIAIEMEEYRPHAELEQFRTVWDETVGKEFNLAVIVLTPGMRLVDPLAPAQPRAANSGSVAVRNDRFGVVSTTEDFQLKAGKQ